MSCPPDAPVRIGVAGLGRMGRLHARTLAGLAEARLCALVDPDEGARTDLARALPGIACYANLDAALRESDAEAWVVATRTPSHVPLARKILQAGASALVEKPLAESADAARALSGLAAPDSRNLMLGHLLLFAPEFNALRRAARERGPIAHFHFVRHRPAATVDLYPEETPLSLLMVHDLYLAFALMDGAEPARLSARLRPCGGGRYNLAQADLEWENGAWGSFTASFLTPPGMPDDGYDRIEVFGEGWAAQLRLNPQRLQLYSDRLTWPQGLAIDPDPVSPSGWLAEELRAFCRAVRGRADIPQGARYHDALRMLEWMAELERKSHAR